MTSHSFVRLSELQYSEQERAVILGFEGRGFEDRSFDFFPDVFYPKANFSEEEISSLAGLGGVMPEKISLAKNSVGFSFQNFSDLKKFVSSMSKILGFRPVIIEPERQFLISRKWGYFDFFEEKDGGLVQHPLLEIMPEDTGQHEIMSNVLRTPVSYVGRKRFAELFMQNLFFGEGQSLGSGPESANFPENRFLDFAEIDFGAVICAIAQLPNNLPLSSGCRCCEPKSISDANVLPSTIVLARFLRDGIYFDSVSRAWSNKFHAENASKGSRQRMKSEYNLDHYPCGPFFRNSTKGILLCDAKALVLGGLAEIVSVEEFDWHCMRHESFFSHEISILRKMAGLAQSGVSKKPERLGNTMSILELSQGNTFGYVSELATYSLGTIPLYISLSGSRFFLEKPAYCFDSFGSAIWEELNRAVCECGVRSPRRVGNRVLIPNSKNASFALNGLEGLYHFEKNLLKLRFGAE